MKVKVSATCPSRNCDVDKIAVMLRVLPMFEEESDVDVGDLEVVAYQRSCLASSQRAKTLKDTTIATPIANSHWPERERFARLKQYMWRMRVTIPSVRPSDFLV